MAYNTVDMGKTVGSVLSFGCIRNTQAIRINAKAIYKLECWGAGGGGKDDRKGGNGGYSVGYLLMDVGTVIYVCCGKAGVYGAGYGYNGGTTDVSANPTFWYGVALSGGATHFARMDGELKNIGESNKSKVLIVAGGGGSNAPNGYGGAGGGLTGGDGENQSGTGATQTSGYAFGQGQKGYSTSDGYGGHGGGGWYGGKGGGWAGTYNHGGGGGSGYIGGVPALTIGGVTYSPSTVQGGYADSGGYRDHPALDGVAKITLARMADIPVIFNGTQLEKIVFNGTELEHLVHNGSTLY